MKDRMGDGQFQAFPVSEERGMTYREWLIGIIGAGLASGVPHSSAHGMRRSGIDILAGDACDLADAIIKRINKKERI